jgi:hypothetical protein
MPPSRLPVHRFHTPAFGAITPFDIRTCLESPLYDRERRQRMATAARLGTRSEETHKA